MNLLRSSNKWSRWSTKFSSVLPKIHSNSILQKWSKYLESVYFDYRDVVVETIADAKAKPVKTSIIVGGLLFFGYCTYQNPDEQTFHQHLISNRADVLLVGKSVRNPISAEYVSNLQEWHNQKLLRRLSFGVFSVMWLDNSSEGCGLFRETCVYSRPDLASFRERIIDVGFLNRWWMLRKRMENYDVNPSEWRKAF